MVDAACILLWVDAFFLLSACPGWTAETQNNYLLIVLSSTFPSALLRFGLYGNNQGGFDFDWLFQVAALCCSNTLPN
jgi:hypothetical protein